MSVTDSDLTMFKWLAQAAETFKNLPIEEKVKLVEQAIEEQRHGKHEKEAEQDGDRMAGEQKRVGRE